MSINHVWGPGTMTRQMKKMKMKLRNTWTSSALIMPALTLILALTLATPGWTQTLPDSPEARRTMALEFVHKVPPNWLVSELVKEMTRKAPKQDRQALRARLMQRIDMQTIREIHVKYLVKYFTASEIRTLTNFYGTKTGVSMYQRSHKFASRSARETFPHILSAYQSEMKTKAQAEWEEHDF